MPAAPAPAVPAAPPATLEATIERETSPAAPDARSSSSPSSSSLHGRFEPGRRLGSRYRVVGLLGRGGMGEVYRADDLELNQSVALKFLPERVSRNAADLARLRSEVRTARQIAHPNVCRTYDIQEADGQVFVVMEYVDGEDLSSVLRRLGRPSHDKALEIARQLCLGLGAAHENGVLHRDLKPANIMIDGRGRVRITDFGLAGTAEEIAAEGGISGTPAYMAPEQRRSGGGSIQSDIFSLGLVLYEIFTGKKVSDMTPRPDPSRPGDSSVRTPSSVVGGIDPAVERVILRCLEHDPARRPQSAYAVYGALPGGDPLAAAVAAGETPSPELVANAGVEGSVRPLLAGVAAATVLIGLIAISFIQRPLFAGSDRPPQVLAVQAEEVLTAVTGKSAPNHSAEGFEYAPAADSTQLRTKIYWRRWNPFVMASLNVHFPGVNRDDPPQAHPGSGTVILSPAGRLLALSIVPDLRADSTLHADSAASAAPDWSAVLRAAQIDPAKSPVAAVPKDFVVIADTVAAWRTSLPAEPETTLVAAALRGRIIEVSTHFGDKVIRAQSPDGARPDDAGVQMWMALLLFQLTPIIGGIILTRRNLRAGRGDVRGALTLGVSVLLFYAAEYVFTVRAGEMGLYRLFEALAWQAPLGHALIHAVTMTIAYLAIEPYVRRLWPSVLVSWARLVVGRWRDPIVGRDILIGSMAGIGTHLLYVAYELGARALGLESAPYQQPQWILQNAMSQSGMLAATLHAFAVALLYTTVLFTVLVIARFILRNSRFAIVAMVLVIALTNVKFGAKTTWLEVAFGLVGTSFGAFIALRFGYVAAIVSATVAAFAAEFPWTTDFSAWFAPQTFLGWAIVAGLLAYGLLTALGGKSLFSDPLSDPVIGPGGRRGGGRTGSPD